MCVCVCVCVCVCLGVTPCMLFMYVCMNYTHVHCTDMCAWMLIYLYICMLAHVVYTCVFAHNLAYALCKSCTHNCVMLCT